MKSLLSYLLLGLGVLALTSCQTSTAVPDPLDVMCSKLVEAEILK